MTMEELVTLIDEHTVYFRGHLETLAKTERRVYIAVINLWQPSKPSEIAERACMDFQTVSTMLGRLLDRGTGTVSGSGQKRLYSAAQRLYSIYFKLKHERDEADIVKNLIPFMMVFYSKEEQQEIFHRSRQDVAVSTKIRDAIDEAVTGFPEFDRLYSNKVGLDTEEPISGKFALSGRFSSGTAELSGQLNAANNGRGRAGLR